MNTLLPLKKTKLLSHLEKSSSNVNILRSNKREISIIQEVKENNTKTKNSKSPISKNIPTPIYTNKLHKNNSTLFRNSRTKRIPLDSDIKNKFKNILYNNELDRDKNRNRGKEFYNKLSLERINFQFEEYGEYPNDDFQPSIYFFKFLANKPDYEKENQEKGKVCTSKLKLFIPDTIVLNDLDTNYWVFTDIEGNVNRVEESDNEVIEKFKPMNDKNELIAVSKIPIMRDGLLGENQLTLLNLEELEKCLFSKSGSQIAIQRFVKCRGPRAFLCRSVWRREKPPYVYILTNKANYLDDEIKNQYLKFVINSKEQSSYSAFYSSSGKHLEETMAYMNNIVKFIESHSDIIFDELAGDFVKDEAGIWWFINLKAMKIKNINKFRRGEGNPDPLPPQLNFFFNQRIFSNVNLKDNVRKFDYQNKIKCKLCGIDYSKKLLKYELTTKMIIETENMLKHVEFNKIKFNVLDRPDLRHTYYSMIYLPYRVCEDCYLLFETLNDIKDYQIEIANLFKIPVDRINFCFNYYTQIKEDKSKIKLTKKELKNIEKMNKEITNMNFSSEEIIDSNDAYRKRNDLSDNDDIHNESSIVPINDSKKNYYNSINRSSENEEQEKISIKENNKNDNYSSKNKNFPIIRKNNSTGQFQSIIKNNNNNSGYEESNKSTEVKKPMNLYRILIMFNDILWNNIEQLPKEDLFIVYSFLGNNYKIPLKIESYNQDLDYTIINFQKIYHIICTEPEGFINFVEKNRYMEVKLGTFEKTEEEARKKEVQKLLRKDIAIEDQDICSENELFKPYAGLDLSIQGLKYGTNYRNNLNGLLFKKDKPYYIGKLRCVIRIHKVKEIKDVSKYVLHNYYNLLIPPVHFVVSDEMPDYWIEIIERQKLREKLLNEIIECMKKNKIKFDKKRDKKKVLQALETLVSYYAKNSA